MTSFLLPASSDPIRPGTGVGAAAAGAAAAGTGIRAAAVGTGIRIAVDGRPVDGLAGQTIAGVLLGSGTLAWRTTSKNARPRGVFCGIGVCYDCLVEVNGQRDVRACQRRAADGDAVSTQYDELPTIAPTPSAATAPAATLPAATSPAPTPPTAEAPAAAPAPPAGTSPAAAPAAEGDARA